MVGKEVKALYCNALKTLLASLFTVQGSLQDNMS